MGGGGSATWDARRAPSGLASGFGKRIADKTEKWAKVIRFAGIQPK
jgi:hypothetical protein